MKYRILMAFVALLLSFNLLSQTQTRKYFTEDVYSKHKHSETEAKSETGCIKGDCQNGYGQYQHSNGKYTGEYIDGKRHGFGIYVFTDSKDSYIGRWYNNEKHGQGYYTRNNNSLSVGEWHYGKKLGTFVEFTKNACYYRVYVNNKLHSSETFYNCMNETIQVIKQRDGYMDKLEETMKKLF